MQDGQGQPHAGDPDVDGAKMRITRRPATDDDVDFARAAHHRGYRDTVVRQFGRWDEARQDVFFEEGWRAAQHEILLCDGEPCGYVSVEQFPDYTHVRELVVHPDFQRRGIGSAFLREVIAEAEARQVPVRLGVLRENTAIEFYRNLGFAQYGETETHILLQHWAVLTPDGEEAE